MFYVITFGLIAVLAIVAFITLRSRNREELHAENAHHRTGAQKQKRKAQRTQSKQARRKRH